jgi:hypothetical protein
MQEQSAQEQEFGNDIETIDLRKEDLSEVVRALSKCVVEDKLLLHGTRVPALSILTPSFDADKLKREALFATDNPLVALARACGGQDVVSWNRYLQFVIKDEEARNRVSGDGYIYLIDKQGMEGLTDDPSEFVAFDAKPATKVLIVNAEIMKEVFRTPDMLQAQTDNSGMWKKESLKKEDKIIASELLNHSARLFLAETVEDDRGEITKQKLDCLKRFRDMLRNLAPIITSLGEDDNEIMQSLDNIADIVRVDLQKVYNIEYARLQGEVWDEYDAHAQNPANIFWKTYGIRATYEVDATLGEYLNSKGIVLY